MDIFKILNSVERIASLKITEIKPITGKSSARMSEIFSFHIQGSDSITFNVRNIKKSIISMTTFSVYSLYWIQWITYLTILKFEVTEFI